MDEGVNEFNKHIGRSVFNILVKAILLIALIVGIITFVLTGHKQTVDVLDLNCTKYSQTTGECIEFKYVPFIKE